MALKLWISVLFLQCLLLIAPAAAQSPQEITERLIAEVAKAEKLTPAFDYVDWEGAYAAMEPSQREYLGIRSATEFRSYQIGHYDGQDSKVAGGLDAAISKAPPGELARLRQMQEHLSKSVEDQRAAAEKAFTETSYAIGEVTEEGDTAKVALVKERGEVVINDVVEFIRVGSKWKLKSAAPFNPLSGAPVKEQRRSLLGPPLAAPGEGLVRPF